MLSVANHPVAWPDAFDRIRTSYRLGQDIINSPVSLEKFRIVRREIPIICIPKSRLAAGNIGVPAGLRAPGAELEMIA